MLVYHGDHRNARQLLAAMGRRLSTQGERPGRVGQDLGATFREERRRRREEHLLLSRLVVVIEPGPRVALASAPDAAEALREAFWLDQPDGPADPARLGRHALPGLLPLRDLLGMIGALEWRRKGVEIPALGAHLHPRYGVFAPVRGEHVELVAAACKRWPVAGRRALDVGTGTGVLAFVLARAGALVTATDLSPGALASAREDARRLGLASKVEVVAADLFPGADQPAPAGSAPLGPFDLVVCNPPWLPAEAVTPLDRAIYDPDGAFLARFLTGLRAHLAPGGEAWLILSDLAELLGLRRPGELEAQLEAAGLSVAGGIEALPHHPRSRDPSDPLAAARRREVTTLRRLVAAPGSPPPG